MQVRLDRIFKSQRGSWNKFRLRTIFLCAAVLREPVRCLYHANVFVWEFATFFLGENPCSVVQLYRCPISTRENSRLIRAEEHFTHTCYASLTKSAASLTGRS